MPDIEPQPPTAALRREPAAWIVAVVALAAAAHTAGAALGWKPPLIPALPGGLSAILGAIVMVSFAVEVARRRILRDLDRRLAVVAVLAGFAALLATLTSIDDSGDAVPGLPGAVLAAVLLVMYPFAAAGLVFLSLHRWTMVRRTRLWATIPDSLTPGAGPTYS